MAGYADHYGSRRPRARARQRGGRGETDDVAVTVITIQVIACIILILAFVIYKKADETAYNGFKGEYTSLMRDRERNNEIMDMFSGVADSVSDAVNAFENYLSRLLSGFGGGGVTEEDGLSSSDESRAEISSENGAAYSPGNYNYLSDGDLLASGGSTGAGGWFPVNVPSSAESLAAPEGSVLSPVLISAKLKSPVTGIITSGFGYRLHPVTGEPDFHTGMDIAADEGTAVLAALPGLISQVGKSDIYGNYIIIRHSDKLETFYAHCSEIIAGEGMLVRQGERIAKVGQTGVTTGPHLHFSVVAEGLNTDPYWVLKDNIKTLNKE